MESQRWELGGLLPAAGTPAMEERIAAMEGRLVAFEGRRDDLVADMASEAFSAMLSLYEALYADVSALGAYSYLWFSEDTANQECLAFRARINQLVADLENRTLFFTLWWRQLDDPAADRLLAVAGDVRYFLESLRLFKPYTLSEPEERIINIKNVNGIDRVLTIYDMITNRLEFHLMVDGEEQTLTRGQLMAYASDPSAKMRAAAYQELHRVYSERSDVLAEIYAARVCDWTEEQVKVRGFASPISVHNLANDLPDAVVETLLGVIKANVGLFRWGSANCDAMISTRRSRHPRGAILSMRL